MEFRDNKRPISSQNLKTVVSCGCDLSKNGQLGLGPGKGSVHLLQSPFDWDCASMCIGPALPVDDHDGAHAGVCSSKER